jgi:hypothetical protein
VGEEAHRVGVEALAWMSEMIAGPGLDLTIEVPLLFQWKVSG